MQNSIIIRQATLDDRSNLFDFYKKAYTKGKYKYPERWKWLYNSNPYCKNTIPIWIALDKDKIIGHTGAMIVPLFMFNKQHIAAWSVDTILFPEYRGLGLGKKLQKANQDAHNIFFAINPSVNNRIIKTKIGGIESDYVFHMSYNCTYKVKNFFFSAEKQLKKYLGPIFGVAVNKSLIYAGVYTLLVFLLKKKLNKKEVENSITNAVTKLEFQKLQNPFDENMNKLWEKCKNIKTFQVEKTATYLNWKFIEQPHIKFNIYNVYYSTEFVGVIVLRVGKHPEPKIGVIEELIYEKEEYRDEMIDFAIGILNKYSVDSIRCIANSLEHKQNLENRGFNTYNKEKPIFYFKNMDISETDLNKQNIYFNYGDHDIDQYPRLRSISYFEWSKILKHD